HASGSLLFPLLGKSVMNNFSLFAANRLTHLKVVVVALVFSTLVVGIGFAARVADGSGTANATVVKPGKPVTATAGERRTTRSQIKSLNLSLCALLRP